METVAAIIVAAAQAASAKREQDKAASQQKKMERILTAPKSPAPKIEEPGEADLMGWMRKRKGRAGTILTGDLVPMDTGKRSLLG
jgi:hypothetical protein